MNQQVCWAFLIVAGASGGSLVAAGDLYGQISGLPGEWHLWSVDGVAPAHAVASRTEERVSRRWPNPDPDSILMRFEYKLLDREMEVFSDGTFRMTSVRRYHQSVYAPDVLKLADSTPPPLAGATGYVPIETRVDTIVRIGEWVAAGDSATLRISNAGLSERVADRLGMGDPEREAALDSIVSEIADDWRVLGVARFVGGRLVFTDRDLGQEMVLTRERRWE